MDNALIQNILPGYDKTRYPEALLSDCEALECLAHSDLSETLLVKDRTSGGRFVRNAILIKPFFPMQTRGRFF